jgi:alkylation response protein AidB-like acyl-CoA dehydrogenase
MAKLGWMGLPFPGRYGGTGGTFLDLTVLLEEMGRACLPGPFFTTVVLGGMTILESGNEAQKQEWLREISEGKLVITLALFEPGIGYSTNKLTVEAIARGDNYIINGTKLFVPDAHVADFIICVSKTKGGVTLLLVEGKSAGIKCSLLKTMAGDKQREVLFDGVSVPKRNTLGMAGRGEILLRKVLLSALRWWVLHSRYLR